MANDSWSFIRVLRHWLDEFPTVEKAGKGRMSPRCIHAAEYGVLQLHVFCTLRLCIHHRSTIGSITLGSQRMVN